MRFQSGGCRGNAARRSLIRGGCIGRRIGCRPRRAALQHIGAFKSNLKQIGPVSCLPSKVVEKPYGLY
jgi:hypothetical protein